MVETSDSRTVGTSGRRTAPVADRPHPPAPAPGPSPAVARARDGAPLARANGRPETPDEMRREIEATRDRLSRTLDDLETRLAHQKEALWSKATLRGLRRKISEEPFRSMAIAFAAGYIIAAIRD